MKAFLPSSNAISNHRVELLPQCTPSQIVSTGTIHQQQLAFFLQSASNTTVKRGKHYMYQTTDQDICNSN